MSISYNQNLINFTRVWKLIILIIQSKTAVHSYFAKRAKIFCYRSIIESELVIFQASFKIYIILVSFISRLKDRSKVLRNSDNEEKSENYNKNIERDDNYLNINEFSTEYCKASSYELDRKKN